MKVIEMSIISDQKIKDYKESKKQNLYGIIHSLPSEVDDGHLIVTRYELPRSSGKTSESSAEKATSNQTSKVAQQPQPSTAQKATTSSQSTSFQGKEAESNSIESAQKLTNNSKKSANKQHTDNAKKSSTNSNHSHHKKPIQQSPQVKDPTAVVRNSPNQPQVPLWDQEPVQKEDKHSFSQRQAKHKTQEEARMSNHQNNSAAMRSIKRTPKKKAQRKPDNSVFEQIRTAAANKGLLDSAMPKIQLLFDENKLPVKQINIVNVNDGTESYIPLDNELFHLLSSVVIGKNGDITMVFRDATSLQIAPANWAANQEAKETLFQNGFDFYYENLDLKALSNALQSLSSSIVDTKEYIQYWIVFLPIIKKD